MTDDIVKRLFDSDHASALTNEAGREIERLRKKLISVEVERNNAVFVAWDRGAVQWATDNYLALVAGLEDPKGCPECLEQARINGIGGEREAALMGEIERLTRDRDRAIQDRETDDGMQGAVVHAIRQVLYAANVPTSAFIDDHVSNAIAQRNAAQAKAEKLKGALVNCADDLEAEIEARYESIKHHPAMARKYNNDMKSVHAARAALEE